MNNSFIKLNDWSIGWSQKNMFYSRCTYYINSNGMVVEYILNRCICKDFKNILLSNFLVNFLTNDLERQYNNVSKKWIALFKDYTNAHALFTYPILSSRKLVSRAEYFSKEAIQPMKEIIRFITKMVVVQSQRDIETELKYMDMKEIKNYTESHTSAWHRAICDGTFYFYLESADSMNTLPAEPLRICFETIDELAQISPLNNSELLQIQECKRQERRKEIDEALYNMVNTQNEDENNNMIFVDPRINNHYCLSIINK